MDDLTHYPLDTIPQTCAVDAELWPCSQARQTSTDATGAVDGGGVDTDSGNETPGDPAPADA